MFKSTSKNTDSKIVIVCNCNTNRNTNLQRGFDGIFDTST